MAEKSVGSGRLEMIFAALVWILCAASIAAQSSSASLVIRPELWGLTSEIDHGAEVPLSADAVIEQMSAAAGVIFAGQVTAVRRPGGFAGSGQHAAAGIVEIEFRVDAAVRGVAAQGGVYTLREWAGLWSGNVERYRIGERALVFLYEPDAHVLSSPVHGPEGIVPLRGGGVAPGPNESTTSAAEWLVDLRWLQVQALKIRTFQALPIHTPVRPSPFHSLVTNNKGEQITEGASMSYVRRAPEPAASVVLVSETEPLTQVLARCQRAMRGTNVVR